MDKPWMDGWIDCRRCSLWESRNRVVIGSGMLPADVFLVGEAPGAEDDRVGEPFKGRSGQLLRRIVASELESYLIRVYIANLIGCRPPKNRPPRDVEVDKCSPRLQQLLQDAKPALIIAVGASALFHLASLHPLTKYRGQIQEVDGLPAPLLPTWHPSYLLRTGDVNKTANLRDDLALARKFLQG